MGDHQEMQDMLSSSGKGFCFVFLKDQVSLCCCSENALKLFVKIQDVGFDYGLSAQLTNI